MEATLKPKFSVGQRVRLTSEAASWISRRYDACYLSPEALTAMVCEVASLPTLYSERYGVNLPIPIERTWFVREDELSEVSDDG